MAQSSDVSPGDEATAVQHNALRDDALRILLNNKTNPATLSTGVLTLTAGQGFYVVAAESGTTDQLDTTTGGSPADGDVIVLLADSGDTITIADSASTDGFSLNGKNAIITAELPIAFVYDSGNTTWVQLFAGLPPVQSVQIVVGDGVSTIQDGDIRDLKWLWDAKVVGASAMAKESGTVTMWWLHDTWANFPPGTASDIKGTITLTNADKGTFDVSAWLTQDFAKGEVSRLYVNGNATTMTQVTIEVEVIRKS